MTETLTGPSRPDAVESVRLHVELDGRINYAMQQNAVPVLKVVRIENGSDQDLTDLELRVVAEPAFAPVVVRRIAAVGAGGVYSIDDLDLDLSPGYLFELTERVRGVLRFDLVREGCVVTGRVVDVELLARDEWGGRASLPEILAAFVMPNHPALAPVLQGAAALLESWTQDASLAGYQHDSRQRCAQMAAAIYGALQQRRITYVNPLASFGENGQRIRLPDRLLGQGMATCLDIAVLTAGCLEAIGLHPLLVLTRGHAFVGVWLQEECFGEPASDDILRLSKRVELGEIAVFDPTCATASGTIGFDDAMGEARRRLALVDDFDYLVDVRRSRIGRILPLPELADGAARQGGSGPPGSEGGVRAPSAPTLGGVDLAAATPANTSSCEADTPASRLDRWQSKLLDLSLRNRLLNFKENKKTIPLLCQDLAALEDRIAAGKEFKIHPRPTDLGPADPRSLELHRRQHGEDPLQELLAGDLQSQRLRADLTETELQRRLTELFRAARVAVEEGGSSVLYLTLGMLEWYVADKSDQPRRAPILMLPVELRRKSIHEGFSLRVSDEDPFLNVTLLEMLRRQHGVEIPGLDPLPEDDSGVDVPEVMRRVRHAVRDIDKWHVRDDAWLGLFSFTKFLMWKDLISRADDLMRSKIVDHLINTPTGQYVSSGDFPATERLDEEHPPAEVYCPLSADSSQLAAVLAAAKGRSFVLEGPPGTGKSQTITNLIAHCLAEGKRVLFVSEKMAALEVVHRRLTDLGLERFCLELHSNKISKQEVIRSLGSSLDAHARHSKDAWEQEARRLAALRTELNAYVRKLHEKRSTGESVYQVLSRLIRLRETPRVELQWPSVDAVDADRLASMREAVRRLITAAMDCGDLTDHPWAAVQRTDWKPGWQEDVVAAVARLAERTGALRDSAAVVGARLSLGGGPWTKEQLGLLDELAAVLLENPRPPREMLLRTGWDAIEDQLESWIVHGRFRDAMRAEVLKRFTSNALALDTQDLEQRLQVVARSVWPASWWRRRFVSKSLAAVSVTGKAPPAEGLSPAVEELKRLQQEERRLEECGEQARALLDRHWNDAEADWDQLEALREWTRRFRSISRRLARGDLDRATQLRAAWCRLATEGADELVESGTIGRELGALRAAFAEFGAALEACQETLELDPQRAFGDPSVPDLLGRIVSRGARWQASPSRLRYWCAWVGERTRAVQQGLGPLAGGCEAGRIAPSDLTDVFEASFARWWWTRTVDAEPLLSGFSSAQHERKIREFREIDARYTELTQQLVQARLAAQVPASNLNIGTSELGILKREMGKRRRHMPIRKLFQRIPHVLPRLKPCLLMSPISVAQFLDPAHPAFDVVVFDEASQIPVWDAIGAIARGNQAVIVGDPKQLPPTNFFQRSDDDDEVGEDQIEDLESILEDCISANIPWRRLEWHYRSRHESLITFSNHRYYDNRLLTFPSADREGMGVSWRHVAGGVYDKGRSRTNQAEAEAVVGEIRVRLHDPARADQSIGVVTFSQAQQALIENLLDDARMLDPELDEHFAEGVREPVFVKNLENVQGDERDVILFSICYGPDAQGRVAMHFGPMNRAGGERRLNVAITRARREVIVFSTLRSEQIDLSRTQAKGVRDLKLFLEYAERGPSALASEAEYDAARDYESPFEQDVAENLERRGWLVHTQVGCSGYRIDLAVVDPEAPGTYLLGIECDGAHYHSAKTARDRDRLREAVLRDLGWEIHRVWSTDWWQDQPREVGKLEAALEAAQEAARGRREARTVAEEGVVEETSAGDGASRAQDIPDGDDPNGDAASVAGASVHVEPGTHEGLRGAMTASFPSTAPPPDHVSASRDESPLPVYREAELDFMSWDLYDPASRQHVARTLATVVEVEGPVLLEVAARRVGNAFGLRRVTQRAVDLIHSLVPGCPILGQRSPSGEIVLWPDGSDPNGWTDFRVPESHFEGRPVSDIPLVELANAVRHILVEHISVPEEDLIRETGRLFGIGRVGRLVRERLEQAIEAFVREGKARRDGGMVIVTD